MTRNSPAPLGLVLQLATLYQLPFPISALLQTGRGEWVLMIVALGLQLAAGLVMTSRTPARIVAEIYAAVAVAVTAILVIVMANEAKPLVLVGIAVEGLAGPAVVLASTWPGGPHRASRRIEAAAVLTIIAITALANTVIRLEPLRHLDGKPLVYLQFALTNMVEIAVAILALHAATALRSRSVASARRTLLTFTVVAIASRAVATIGATIVRVGMVDDLPIAKIDLIAGPLAYLVFVSLGVPLAIWGFVEHELRDDDVVVERYPPVVPAWGALWCVSMVLAQTTRGADSRLEATVLGLVVTLAIAMMFAGFAGVRGARSTWLYAAFASVIAAVVLAIVAGVLLTGPRGHALPLWSLAVVVALLATLAWSHRPRRS
ncbi:MAG: hypothetical protein ABI867_15120 [Kofleriaceae bacterium]